MPQHYSNPRKESDPWTQPDLETFRVGLGWRGCPRCEAEDAEHAYGSINMEKAHRAGHVGWYWQSCFPGCVPHSDTFGPFATEAEALADARRGIGDDDEAEPEP